MSISTTAHLQQCLVRLANKDLAAKTELLGFARRRLRSLAEQMFRRSPQLYLREQSDDLFQEAMSRLWQSVDEVGPTTVPQFMGLAALQMRRALCDLARNHFGRDKKDGVLPNVARMEVQDMSQTLDNPADQQNRTPEVLLGWAEFHSAAGQLPEPCRTAFDLLYYHEMPQSEVAALMNVSVRQVQRYWHSARLKLCRMIGGTWPEL